MTNEVVVLFVDLCLNSGFEFFALEVGEIVVREIFELKLIGSTFKSLCVSRSNNRVSELPNLAYGVLKSTVTVNHNLNALAGSREELFLNSIYNGLAVTGEELYLILGCLVGAKQAVVCIEARAVYGSIQDLVKAENDLGTCCLKDTL